MGHPFPLPSGMEGNWGAREHQQAANYYWFEAQGYNEAAYQAGTCDANYKPMQTLMLSEHKRHTAKAAAKRRQA